MVVTPKEAARITEEELKLAAELESRIDELIRRNARSRITYHNFEVPAVLDVGLRVLKEIELRYSPHYTVTIDCSKSPAYIHLTSRE